MRTFLDAYEAAEAEGRWTAGETMILQRMRRKLHQFRAIGAHPECFLAGVDMLREIDAEADQMGLRYVTNTEQRKHREFEGVPVVASNTARRGGLELVVRHPGAVAVVEVLA